MNIIRRVFLLSLLIELFVAVTTLNAQTRDTLYYRVENDIERILEEYDPDDDESVAEELIKSLQELAANPLNINRVSITELGRVPGMTMTLAGAIIDYRENIKPFAAVEELTEVRGIGESTLYRIRPYLSVGSSAELRRDLYMNPGTWIHNSRLEVYTRYRRIIQEQDGYQTPDSLGGYIGSPVNYYQRFHFRSDHLSMNLTQRKSPGEELGGPSRFDHNIWHVGLRNLGRLRKVVIGNYSVRFGQGLILRSGAAFGKGMDVIRSANRSGQGIRGYTSSQSANAFRGIALSYGNRVQLTGFYSDRKRTASVVSGDTIRFPVNTEVYNTLNELERQNNTSQMTAGGRVGFEHGGLSLGTNTYLNRFSRPVQRGQQPYQKYAFEGRKASAISVDYNYRIGSLNLFGETGRSANGGYGIVSRLESVIGNNTELAFAYRNYDYRFQSVFGGSFAEQSGNPRNEKGFYLGLRHSVSETVRLSGYFDQFRFPAPRFQTRQPTLGHDWLVLMEYQPNRDTEFHLLVRQKVREEEYTSTDIFGRETRKISNNRRLTARIHFGKSVHSAVRLRTRAEVVRVYPSSGDDQAGYLIYQDIRIQARHNLQIDTRVTLFETDGFDSRLYHFENDLLYVFSSTMLFDQGQRLYILFNYRPADKVQIWLKASTTIYENRNVIGSGLNRIEGNVRSDVGVQVRIRI